MYAKNWEPQVGLLKNNYFSFSIIQQVDRSQLLQNFSNLLINSCINLSLCQPTKLCHHQTSLVVT